MLEGAVNYSRIFAFRGREVLEPNLCEKRRTSVVDTNKLLQSIF